MKKIHVCGDGGMHVDPELFCLNLHNLTHSPLTTLYITRSYVVKEVSVGF